MSNAIKFTDDGEIVFGYQYHSVAGELSFFVRDTGIGIDSSKHKLIFEPFTQADNSTTRKYGGTGLGLSISRGLVEIMGGHMWVESEPGQGACFYFSIPYKSAQKQPAVSTDKEDDVFAKVAGASVLVVEDDPTSMLLLEEMLLPYECQVLRAEKGLKAIDVFMENPGIDFVLMDINLPDIDGYEATRRLRRISKDTVIIAQTAAVLGSHEQKAREAGCNDFIRKPIVQQELLNLIAKYR